MKLLKIIAACSLLAFSGQSIAKTTPIQFAKGSYCGSFSGNYNGRIFTISLSKGQTLTIGDTGGVKDVIVKGSNGKTLPYDGQDYGAWITQTKGKHTIKLIPYDKNDAYTTIEFCAY